MQSPLAFPQRFLDVFALGDVFREPGNARDISVVVLDGKSAAADPADQAVGPHDPKLPVRKRAAPVLLHLLDHPVPIVWMNALGQGARLLIEGLDRSSPHVFVTRTEVNDSIVPDVLHPEELVDVLSQLTEALLGLAQRLLGLLA